MHSSCFYDWDSIYLLNDLGIALDMKDLFQVTLPFAFSPSLMEGSCHCGLRVRLETV